MRCDRCGGRMAPEDYMASNVATTGHRAARCVVCWEIVDAQIIENRKKMAEGIPIRH